MTDYVSDDQGGYEVYRVQAPEPVSLLPKTLRTFNQFIYEKGKDDAERGLPRASSMEERYEWLSTLEWCNYHAGYTDGLS